ncbi:hypothetical protein P691DRAFT_723241 [Macrolepiota fuliginosa MF-IS2]|uniref:Uncharacterized protein n=1 Tax=Macrolepiota fuliginosa MF-IS2 TaxID=1400762 RepID=A0A9P5XLE0_9AGAR|nr:hypothetical protein P691DRAFT_723241 [Macrolepiota fuliginosa MF-IS2]
MFKWNKRKLSSGEPTTPKMVLASLPDVDSLRGSPALKTSPTTGKALRSLLGRLTPDRRAETPHPTPVPSHRSKEAHVPRLRTVSMSKHDDDVVLFKPHKVSPPRGPTPSGTLIQSTKNIDFEKPPAPRTSPKYVAPTISSLPVAGGGNRRASNPEHHSVPLKSAMKGGNLHTSTAMVRQEYPIAPLERQISARRVSISPPRNHYVASHTTRSRSSSLTEQHRPGYSTSHQTPKYVPAIIKEGE